MITLVDFGLFFIVLLIVALKRQNILDQISTILITRRVLKWPTWQLRQP